MTILQAIQAAQNWWVRVTENFTAVSPAAMYSLDPASANLNLKLKGGLYGTTTVADYDTTLTASSGANYVVMARADGAISRATNTTNWNDATNYMRIGIATAGALTFTWVDHRPGREAAGGGGGGAVASVNGQTGAVVLTSDDINEGSTNLYHTAARVRAAVLTGLSLATGGAIAATDTVLQALGKLQKSLTDGLAAAALAGAITSSGLTMTTARLLGRSTASTGAIEEIQIGTGLALVGGVLTATGGGGGSGDVVGPASAVDERIAVFDGTTGKLIKDGGYTVAALLASQASAPVSTESATSHNITAAEAGSYIRFTNSAAKTVTFRPNSTEALPANGEWHLRNVGAGNLVVTPGSGVTLNAPFGGTFTVPQGGTLTVKRVATDEFDLFGMTT